MVHDPNTGPIYVVSKVIYFGSSVGTGAVAITPWSDYRLATNWYTDAVTIVNGREDTIIRTVNLVNSYPGSMFFDPANSLIYVSPKGA